MKAKDVKEVAEMIKEAIHGAVGDFSEYFDYINDRLHRIEELHDLEPLPYADALAAKYGTPN